MYQNQNGKKRRQGLVALFLHFSGCLSAADTTRLKLDTSRLKLNMNRGKISAGASWCPCCIFTLLLLLQETSRPTPANSSPLLQKSKSPQSGGGVAWSQRHKLAGPS